MSKVVHSSGVGVELCLTWREVRNGDIPHGAVSAGHPCFVCRVRHEGQYVPGKYSPGPDDDRNVAYISYDGKEHIYEECEVLVESGCGVAEDSPHYEWVADSNGTVPKGALVAGVDDGRPLYVARAMYDDVWCSGKVLSDHGCAYMPYGGDECRVEEYDVLVMKKRYA